MTRITKPNFSQFPHVSGGFFKITQMVAAAFAMIFLYGAEQAHASAGCDATNAGALNIGAGQVSGFVGPFDAGDVVNVVTGTKGRLLVSFGAIADQVEVQGGGSYTVVATPTTIRSNVGSGQSLSATCIPNPNTAPTINSSAAASVEENQTSAIDVQSTDDNDSEGSGLTYTKTGGADQALFNIDGTTGVLTFITAPDFEAPSDAGGNNVYDIQVTVTDSGALTDVQDIAITVTNTVGQTQKVIATFMQNRANLIMGNQPDISGFLTGSFVGGGGELGNLNLAGNTNSYRVAFSSSLNRVRNEIARNTAKALSGGDEAQEAQNSAFDPIRGASALSGTTAVPANSNAAVNSASGTVYGAEFELAQSQAAVAPDHKFDIWTKVYGAASQAGDDKTKAWLAFAGVHYFVSQDLIVGGLVQLDWTDETNSVANSSAKGFGWMFGPYIAAKIPDQPLYFDARATWGQSSNKVSPLGTYQDKFDTDRWMISSKVSGKLDFDEFTVSPFVSAAYFSETQKDYTDTLGNLIPSQTFSQGELKFGPDFSKQFLLESGNQLEASVGVAGVWNFDVSNNFSTQGTTLGTNDVRARVDAGVKLTTINQWQLSLTSYYDGIGINGYEAYGGSAKLSVPLN